jgi:PTS system mannose-specific IID component
MSRLRRGDLMRVALRASLLQATWNYERQQGLGWAFALKPVHDRLYPDSAEKRDRLAEHTAYFNTQPTLASLALGAVANLEERRAAGEPIDGAAVSRVKAVLASSLAALGDRLFWFSLRPFAACLGVLLALVGSRSGAVVLWLCYNLVHQTIRMNGVGWGYRNGPAVLSHPLRDRLQGLIRFLGVAGSAVAGVVVAALLVPASGPRPITFQALLALGLGLGLVVAQRGRPSPTEWALGLGAVCVVAARLG